MVFSNGYKSILKNSIFFYASLFLNQVLKIIYIIFIARYLGPDLYGLWSYGQTWYLAFLPIILFGLGPILVKAISKDRKSGVKIADLIVSIRLLLIIVISLLCGLIGYLTADSTELSILLIILSFALIGRSVSLWGEQMFQAYEVANLSFHQEKLFRTSEVLVGISIAYYTHDVLWVALSHAVIWILQGIKAVYLVETKLQKIQLLWYWPDIFKILQQSFPIALALFFNGLIIQGSIIIYKQSGIANEMIGNLAIVVQALMILGSIFASVGKAALPVLNRSVERGDNKDQYYLDVMIRLAFVFGTFVGLCGMTFGSNVVVLLVGAKYQLAMEYLGLMLWVLIPFIIRQSINMVLIAHDYYWRSLIIESISLALMLASIFFLMKHYGFQGIVLSILLAYSSAAIAGIINILQLKLIENILMIVKLIVLLLLSIFLFYLLVDYNRWIALLASIIFLLLNIYYLDIIHPFEKKLIKKLIYRSTR